MSKEKFFFKDYMYFVMMLMIAVYLISIFAINLSGRVWVNYDIYSDAILAKYMWQAKSLFPEGWYFGNQVYVVATPVVAALFYGIVQDVYLALALASCFMTCGIVLSFIWCFKSFANMKSIIISLLVVVGGINIGFTAHADWEGFQVFYTMASYYACYVIGIFFTIGVYFRLVMHKKVCAIIQILVLFYNFALGMQSLRELLVLNLPLCAVVILDMVLHLKKIKENLHEKGEGYAFAFGTLLANICGAFIERLLILNGTIKQNAIISGVSSNVWYNFKVSVREILDYIGIVIPTTSVEYLELVVGVFSIIVVLFSLLYIVFEYQKRKKISEMGYIILFFVISLLAVFCAGLFVISVRDIYYFCWQFLVAASVTLLMEVKGEAYIKQLDGFKNVLMICLLGISVLNYKGTFYQSFYTLPYARNIYRDIVQQLREDDICYIYSDWRVERNQIATMSCDEIQYVTLEFSSNPDDLWRKTGSLYHEEWIKMENFEHAYILLSDYALYCLVTEFSEEYWMTFMDNLELVYTIEADGEDLHFYKGSKKMYEDMIQ